MAEVLWNLTHEALQHQVGRLPSDYLGIFYLIFDLRWAAMLMATTMHLKQISMCKMQRHDWQPCWKLGGSHVPTFHTGTSWNRLYWLQLNLSRRMLVLSCGGSFLIQSEYWGVHVVIITATMISPADILMTTHEPLYNTLHYNTVWL